MENEINFIPYEQALALKKLGFNKSRQNKIHCFYGYEDDFLTLKKK